MGSNKTNTRHTNSLMARFMAAARKAGFFATDNSGSVDFVRGAPHRANFTISKKDLRTEGDLRALFAKHGRHGIAEAASGSFKPPEDAAGRRPRNPRHGGDQAGQAEYRR